MTRSRWFLEKVGSILPKISNHLSCPRSEFILSLLPNVLTFCCRYVRQTPLLVLVGPERIQYYLHKGLAAAKSPFFRTILKDCWNNKKEEVELPNISSDGFDIVVDWIYSGQLPDRLKGYSKHSSYDWEGTLQAYKAADMLMIDKLQNDLIAHEIALFAKHKLAWRFYRLQDVYDNDLCHTKYYQFVLKCAVSRMMSNLDQSTAMWEENVKYVEGNPQVLADLLTKSREWAQKPWKDFLKGDLTEFLIQETESYL